MRLSSVFVNPQEHRLRAGWRLLLQTLLMLLFITLGSLPVVRWMPHAVETNAIGAVLLLTAISGLAITASVYIARRWLDRRPFSTLGFPLEGAWPQRDLVCGLGISMGMMGLIYLVEWSLGWLRYEGMAWQVANRPATAGEIIGWTTVFLMVGWYEELLSRGYHLRNLADGLNLPLGIVLSSAVFALAHGDNPSSSWMSTLGLCLAGVWFAYAAVSSRGLWLPIGAHIGWNIAEGLVFGFPVSGLQVPGLVRQVATGPEVWTGGAFGPEAGLVVLPALALGAAAIWLYTRRRRG